MKSETGFLLDVNVLLGLTLVDHVHHQASRAWLASLSAQDRWVTTPLTETALARLLLNPHIAGQHLDGDQVLGVLSQLHAEHDHVFLADDARLIDGALDLTVLVSSKQVTGLHLVALAAKHGLRLVTFDSRLAKQVAPSDRQHLLLLAG